MTRLEAIFSVLKPCGVFADIGCDHGYISRHMASKAQRVIACDISSKCLSKAQKLLGNYGNIEFVISDGLNEIKEKCAQIALCGMGGHTITKILSSPKISEWQPDLIIQPQNDAAYVRKFLFKSNYKIVCDIVAFESNKYYDIIRAESGREETDAFKQKFGRFYKEKNPILLKRLKEEREKIRGYKPTLKNVEKLREIEEALRWQE